MNCIGTIEWSDTNGVWFGEVISGIVNDDLVYYEAADEDNIQIEFEEAVRHYLGGTT